ncbi:MAG: choice-of-anchor Q domain-containing protein [Cyclobacteriaceae bacterium]
MRFRLLGCWVIGLLGLGILACTPEAEIISDSPGNPVTFDADTVLFDTLFTSVGSTTRRLRVVNPNRNAITISNIELAGGAQSPYSIIVNGDEGVSFDDVVVFGKDSLLILVEVTIDPGSQNLPFLVKDSILFDQQGFKQDVDLVAWGQDANFLRNVILDCDETWIAEKPYIIMEAVLIDSLCHLNVEKGAKIFFDNNASLFVQGQIEVRGDTAQMVEFRSLRNDGILATTSGQWNGIFILEGSEGNVFDHAIISNAQVGLRVGTPDDNDIPDITISNSIIENMSQAGILAFTSDVFAYNTLIYNAGAYLVGGFAGGNYQYWHCTFTNDPNDFRRNESSVQFSDNLVLADNSLLAADLNLELINSIVWGNLQDEIFISVDGGTNSTLVVQNNILRSTATEFDTNGNLLSQETNFPGFVSPFQREYRIDSLSPARDAGVPLGIEFDFRKLKRDEGPDIGAFERIDPIE